jgi:2-C-methyl-D-erythritol 4-phosphate cytidylyltransferase
LFNTAIITAGGSGRRLPGAVKKQFRLLNKRPIIFHSIDVFISHPAVSHLIITFSKEDLINSERLISEEYGFDRITICEGGKERQESVMHALEIVPKETDYVLIHDAVRPFITHELVSRLLDLAVLNGAAIPVSPVKYTIKKGSNGFIEETVPRENLFEVHTPQVFEFHKLLEFHRQVSNLAKYFTDDASIYEYFNVPVAMLVSDLNNIKITDSFDLEVAQMMMQRNKLE